MAAVVAAPSYGRTSTYGPSSEPGSSGSASGPAYSAAASPRAATLKPETATPVAVPVSAAAPMSCGLSTGSSVAAISGTGRGRSRLIGEALSADARSKTSISRVFGAYLEARAALACSRAAPASPALRSSTAHQESARSSRAGRRKTNELNWDREPNAHIRVCVAPNSRTPRPRAAVRHEEIEDTQTKHKHLTFRVRA